MKTFLKIFFALFTLSFLYVGNVYATITNYNIKYPGSIVCYQNMVVSRCSFQFSDDGVGSYNSDTHVLSLNMFEVGPTDKLIVFKIPFRNGIAQNVHACYSALTGDTEPMYKCEKSQDGQDIAIFANASFDQMTNRTAKNITLQTIKVLSRSGQRGISTTSVVDQLLTPISQ